MCGSERGTAFFISPDTLLTARHIIVDYIESNHAEEITIDTGKQILCTPIYLAEEGDNIDIILLKSIDYTSSFYLNLLSTNFTDPLYRSIIKNLMNLYFYQYSVKYSNTINSLMREG